MMLALIGTGLMAIGFLRAGFGIAEEFIAGRDWRKTRPEAWNARVERQIVVGVIAFWIGALLVFLVLVIGQ